MTALDALAEQRRNARSALLRQIDDLGDLVMIARGQVSAGISPGINAHALALAVQTVTEANDIYQATAAAYSGALDRQSCAARAVMRQP